MRNLVSALTLAIFAPLALAQSSNTATITFTAPTTLADGTALPAGSVLSYNVYQGEQGAAKTMVANIKGSPGSVTTGLATGKVYCFQVSAVLNGIEGQLSNEACKSFVAPGTVVIKVS